MKTLDIPHNIQDFFRYDRESGQLFHRRPGLPHVRADRPAGHVANTGYRHIRVLGVRFLAHRIIWFIETGEQPIEEIDHINRDRADNRICNLRLANRAQNSWNMRSKSPFGRGVSWHSGKRKFCAEIRFGGARKYLGAFDSAEDAQAAYRAAAIKYHGEFARIE